MDGGGRRRRGGQRGREGGGADGPTGSLTSLVGLIIELNSM